jgi:hypothetical protein
MLQPEHITGKAGDVVLLHYQTAHSVAPNSSSQIRYATYFRLYSTSHPQDTFRPESMLDIWKDYAKLSKDLIRAATITH